jgi:hypothetical protein
LIDKALLARIDGSWYELVAVVSDIDARSLSLPGQDGWSIKDHLVHIATWELSLLALIQGHSTNEAMGLGDEEPSDIDGINDLVWKLHRDDSVERVLLYFCDSHERLTAALAKLSSDDPLLPYSHYQPNQPERHRPIVEWVGPETFEHYAEHRAWLVGMLSTD